MNLVDYIILAVVALIIGAAVRYIYKAKKRGAKCIGCPSANQCSGQCSSCSCNCSNKK